MNKEDAMGPAAALPTMAGGGVYWRGLLVCAIDGTIMTVAGTIEAHETDRPAHAIAERGCPRTFDQMARRLMPVDGHLYRLANSHGARDPRVMIQAQLETIGRGLEERAHRCHGREALAVEQPAGLVDEAEPAVLVDAVHSQHDVVALLDHETLHRRDVEPRDLHRASLPH